ncbi:F-box domain-containing protein [Mycena chlorophos]|uniref:F-box domain-containing protein n=1 Tax=Mycena chlorophos TaxID=658473 RepID=A0A8H6RXI6_MYCCL|nr:F-box domain-containing protein [Mycena chlorophos]
MSPSYVAHDLVFYPLTFTLLQNKRSTLPRRALHRRFHKHAKGFPTLWKLGLGLTEELGEKENQALSEFLDGLSALTHLHLSNQVEIDWVATLVPLESLWSRLRVCELTECMVDDALLILPHFSAGSRLSLIQGRYIRGAPDTLHPVKHPELMGLSFDRCDDMYITRNLDNLTAPALERLAI